MKTIFLLFLFVPLFSAAQLDRYDVSLDTPGPNSAASMPLGNGDIGLNVWVDPGGDLLFYISKTDAWGQENDPAADPWMKQGGVLMKLGLVRVHVDHVQLSPFRQTLHLADGEIRVQEGSLRYRVWVDANHPVIRVEVSSAKPVDAIVTLHDWRLGQGDTIFDGRRDRVTWVHRNTSTGLRRNASGDLRQSSSNGLRRHASDDPHLAGIEFGGAIEGRGFVRKDDSTLAGRGSEQVISIHPLTVTRGSWIDQLDRQIAVTDRVGLATARAAHRQWWKRFWDRSYIYLHGGALADSVTRGYVLQRFVTACAGRGAYPIKFNGSIFVVDAAPRNADYRAWGGQYWFQNTRPMYWPRLAAGDFDLMMPLFRMYLHMLPGNEALVRKYYGHGGAYFQETTPFWGGLPFMGPDEQALYTHHYFTPILELSMMMLDYYAYTGDNAFLHTYLLPIASAGLEFFDQHFPRDPAGRLLLDPDNSIEMFWKVHDPAPDIAGLHAVLPRMLGLPVDESLKDRWRKLLAILPPLPVDSGRLLPYTGPQTAKPHNEENPELYAIYPFRLYGLGKPDLELARHSFDIRRCPQKGCWSQDPVEAAMLGYADLAKADVSFNLTRKDPGLKFPAFWATGHDYKPDEDNGGNGELGLQQMLLQTDGKTIRLMPAWPPGWDADFKLHAPYRTTIEGKVRNGRLVGLVVTPAERRKDVVVAHSADGSADTDGSRLTRYVDPRIGSGGHGHVFVGASVPFGAVQAGPENIPKGWDWCSGYHYSDTLLIGFSQLHLNGTGIGDLGDVLVMPYSGAVDGRPKSFFSHRNETCRPGYYAVHLDDYDIDVQCTASERVAFYRYRFPDGEAAHVLIDLKDGVNDRATDTHIERVDEHTIEGYRFSTGWAKDQRTYFAIRCDAPIARFEVFNDSVRLGANSGRGRAIKGQITLANQGPRTVQLKIGLSPVSADNALANIEAEIPGQSFAGVARAADEKWERELEKIKVETSSDTDKTIFYTALFHTMIDPMLYNDHNGDYLGADKKVYPHAPFQNYTTFSLWDTYRALNPLYTLIQPERVNDIVNSFLAIDRQQGMLPVWHLEGCETHTMPGVSSVQVIAEAYLKGYRGFDTSEAWAAIKNTMQSDYRGMEYDREDKFIPSDKVNESVARGLEYSISNASAALMAKKMGLKDDYAAFHRRFQNYRQYWDRGTKFFRGRRADGSWDPVFDPVKSSRPWINDLSEGNHWQYLWLVPEDVEGLEKLMGGERVFTKRLDSLFLLTAPPDPHAPPDIAGLIGQYAHGDEPGHQTIYLYSYTGRQWQTAEKARYIVRNLYKDSVDGLSGNEDCGQMSAWYIFSALGFYPVYPASGLYVLGSPLFDRAVLHLAGGKTFTVETVNNGVGRPYIQRVTLNGRPYTKSYILHSTILAGGVLRVTMGDRPNLSFGSAPADRPYTVY